MGNLRRRGSIRKTIVFTIAASAFALNIAISSQLESSNSSLNGIVNSAYAEEEGLPPCASIPLSIIAIEPEEEEETIKSKDESVVDYIINLFE